MATRWVRTMLGLNNEIDENGVRYRIDRDGVVWATGATIRNSHLTVRGHQNVIYGYSLRVFGNGNQVIGSHGNVIGNNNTVDGYSATVRGNHNTVDGSHATVTGNDNHAKGYSVKIHGDRCTLEGNYGHVRGQDNTATGENVTVEGNRNTVTGKYANVTGNENQVQGDLAQVTGNHNTVSGRFSAATGDSNRVHGDYAYATGRRNRVRNNGLRLDVPANASPHRRRLAALRVQHQETMAELARMANENRLAAARHQARLQAMMRQQAEEHLPQRQGQNLWQALLGNFNHNDDGDDDDDEQDGQNNRRRRRPRRASTPRAAQRVAEEIECPSEAELPHDVAVDANDTDSPCCVICRAARPICVALPCMHLSYCVACARLMALDDDGHPKRAGQVECAKCRKPVKGLRRVFVEQ